MQEPIAISQTPPLPGLQLVQQANAAIATVATDFAGTTDPAALAAPYMTWANTSTGQVFRRNAAGTAWVEVGRVFERPFYQSDVAAGVIPTGGYKNALINGNFNVNQLAVSGTVSLSAGSYGHDRWKAGSGGCTYTFSTSNGITTLTITAGTLIQIIEGNNLRSGTYTLSWSGTAQGRIGAGPFSASRVTGSAVGGSNLSIEFGTGTLALTQFEFGSISTLFEYRLLAAEMELCFWYSEMFATGASGVRPFSTLQAVSTTVAEGPLLFRKKRALPSISSAGAMYVTAVGGAPVNVSSVTFSQINDSSANIVVTTTTASLVQGNATLFRGNAVGARINVFADL